jgi:hypothetical protein
LQEIKNNYNNVDNTNNNNSTHDIAIRWVEQQYTKQPPQRLLIHNIFYSGIFFAYDLLLIFAIVADHVDDVLLSLE